MSSATMRGYDGAADLRRMQDAVSRAHGRTWWHVGDLAWMARTATHLELGVAIRLWEDDAGAVAGWVWPSTSGHSDLFWGGRPDDAPFDEMLDAIEEFGDRASAAGDAVRDLVVLVADDEPQLREALLRRGFVEDASERLDVMRRTLADIDVPRLPAGYRLHAVDDDLLDGRVEAQRAAFAPSGLTRRMYERVRRTWPYRSELDRVAVDAGGTVVAHCTAWLDERARSGLLEPVGTHPAHRRRGLATACCLDALRTLAAAGATTAQVSCESGAPACTAYRHAGFTTALHARAYRRSDTG